MPHILVVDDSDDLRESLAELLTLSGFHVSTAASGLEALNDLRARPGRAPDVVLVDLIMPEMGGLAFVEALRSSPAAEIPVIVMTGLDDPRIPRRLRVPVLTKPRLDGLIGIVRAQCRRAPRTKPGQGAARISLGPDRRLE